MESNILIDISYSTREPQIVIKCRESDDPRDKLITMFAGQAMPGVRDGYCRIERSHSQKDVDFIVIVPLDPGEAVKHIPSIRDGALSNAAICRDGFKERIEKDLLHEVNPLFARTQQKGLFPKWEEIYLQLVSELFPDDQPTKSVN